VLTQKRISRPKTGNDAEPNSEPVFAARGSRWCCIPVARLSPIGLAPGQTMGAGEIHPLREGRCMAARSRRSRPSTPARRSAPASASWTAPTKNNRIRLGSDVRGQEGAVAKSGRPFPHFAALHAGYSFIERSSTSQPFGVIATMAEAMAPPAGSLPPTCRA
jgi:hypothetical protein